MNQFARYLSWAWGTYWPLYAATILVTNIVGALGVATFLRFLIPLPAARELTSPNTTTSVLYGAYFVFAITVGIIVTLMLFAPILRWQRHPETYDANMIRDLVKRIPLMQALTGGVLWAVGVAVFTFVASRYSSTWATAVAVTATLGGLMVILMTYMEAERLTRPIAAQALAKGAPDQSTVSPMTGRIMATWALTSAVPVVGMILLLIAQTTGFFPSDLSLIHI